MDSDAYKTSRVNRRKVDEEYPTGQAFKRSLYALGLAHQPHEHVILNHLWHEERHIQTEA